MALRRSSGADALASERRDPGFCTRAMQVLIWGGEERVEKVRRLSELVARDEVFSKKDAVQLARIPAMRRSLEKARRGIELSKSLNLDEEERWLLFFFMDDVNFTALHFHMFVPAIEGQASDAQQREWLPMARALRWIGCYAQTEMGHGSNVQGLETTATFVPQDDAWEIHSPTLTSTKWWPGGLGKVSTHAILYARLLLPRKGASGGFDDQGIHAFLVPLRSLEDHRPLPGVTVGDIGPKFGNGGYNTMDNGFLRFDRVRIPRTNLLMRYVEVSRDGQYRRVNESSRQLAYGAMVYVRKGIVMEAGLFLAKAVTIAVRYSCVRRQFGGPKGGRSPAAGAPGETKVMDYKTQQHRALPLLATAYAFVFVGQWMNELYADLMARIRRGDLSTLSEVHAASAGLKSLTTSVTANAIEECRKLCGGHGYLCASGLPQLYAMYVPACTYEGDNWVLLLQVARYLLKAISRVSQGQVPSGTARYIGDAERLQSAKCPADSAEDFESQPQMLLEALQARAVHLTAAAALAVAGSGSVEEGFLEHSVALTRAARAHCTVIIATNFLGRVVQLEAEAGAKGQLRSGGMEAVLRQLSTVYSLSAVEEGVGDLLERGYLERDQPALLREAMQSALAKLRPVCVPLVDSFGYTDHYLDSALGRFDGDVYQDLYQRAISDPINASPVIECYEDQIKPILQGSTQSPDRITARL